MQAHIRRGVSLFVFYYSHMTTVIRHCNKRYQ